MKDNDYTDLPHPALALGYRSPKKFKSMESRIKNSMKIMARIIAEEGEEYLPIFLRLETELEKEVEKSNALRRVTTLLQFDEKHTGFEP